MEEIRDLTIGDLKKILSECDLPDETPVIVTDHQQGATDEITGFLYVRSVAQVNHPWEVNRGDALCLAATHDNSKLESILDQEGRAPLLTIVTKTLF